LDANGWSAIAACSSAIAAVISLIVSVRSANAQSDMIFFEREKHLYELLSADAIRANDNAQQGYPSDLSFSQASNIAYALDSARNRIQAFTLESPKSKKEKYIRFFRQRLTAEINSYMVEMIPASIDREDPSIDQMEASSSWVANRKFFNFRYCEDEDLSNEDE